MVLELSTPRKLLPPSLPQVCPCGSSGESGHEVYAALQFSQALSIGYPGVSAFPSIRHRVRTWDLYTGHACRASDTTFYRTSPHHRLRQRPCSSPVPHSPPHREPNRSALSSWTCVAPCHCTARTNGSQRMKAFPLAAPVARARHRRRRPSLSRSLAWDHVRRGDQCASLCRGPGGFRDRSRSGRSNREDDVHGSRTASLVQLRREGGVELPKWRAWTFPADDFDRIRPGNGSRRPAMTLNYGGGARWFVKRHLRSRWTFGFTPSVAASNGDRRASNAEDDAAGL